MLGHYSTANFIAFLVIIAVFLWIDLHAHKKDEPITLRNAAVWSCIWIALALAFGAYIGATHGLNDMSLYLSGYFLEKSLSVDNLFVMMAIFSSFAIKGPYQHRVLYYGILGALILRMVFVAAGTTLVELFGNYALAAFGLFVLWSAWKMWQEMRKPDEDIEDYSNHWSVRFTRRFLPVSTTLNGHDFFVKAPSASGALIWKATPLFLCLVVIELCDVMFAFDSIPAIIAITQDPFLVYTSNIFAILGLRSLYFLMAAASNILAHLEKAVIVILAYIGVKMLLGVSGLVHIPPLVSLAVVLGLLIAGVVASLVWPEKKEAPVSENAAAPVDGK
ncbi:Tellurium resistance protein TerC [uncultured delta proteobacterium]|uniref:Tellurium resistance protein TerC n=1 Tax=uncultured delta proteobacterium TaxID=34034 RepID=A0A212JA31_9DELT|nr:Tellurium resistance protein TerC [uncultured delta proteobacterium]